MIGGLGLVGARSGPVDGLSTMGYVLVCVIYCSLIVVSSLGVSTGGRGDVWVVLRCRNRKNLRGGGNPFKNFISLPRGRPIQGVDINIIEVKSSTNLCVYLFLEAYKPPAS